MIKFYFQNCYKDMDLDSKSDKKFMGKAYPSLDFVFCHNARDFVVEEIGLYDFSMSGEHLVLKVRKKNITTIDFINILASI